MARTIDLNLDAGEMPEALADGSEEALYGQVSSVNIACGGHAGDEKTMAQAVALAMRYGLAIGAHPSYPDRAGFGRTRIEIETRALTESLTEQITALLFMAHGHGARLTHVKPHGALYNVCAYDVETANAVIEAVRYIDPTLALVGLAGSPFLQLARAKGLRAVGEAFVDRGYEDDGRLRARSLPDALVTDARVCATRARMLVEERKVQSASGHWLTVEAETLCIHGDTPGALQTARAVREELRRAGIEVTSLR